MSRSSVTVGPDGLQRAVQKILEELPKDADEAIDKATETVAEKAIDKLKATSPIRKGKGGTPGAYAAGWTKKKQKGQTIIHNKTNYQLTHLLEYGHEVVIHGKATGKSTKAQPHIKQVEEMVQKEYPEEFEKELKKLL